MATLQMPENIVRVDPSVQTPNGASAVLQGTIDSSAVTEFFEECVARLGNPSSTPKHARRAAAGAQVDSTGHLLRKPPLPVLAYAGTEGPPAASALRLTGDSPCLDCSACSNASLPISVGGHISRETWPTK